MHLFLGTVENRIRISFAQFSTGFNLEHWIYWTWFYYYPKTVSKNWLTEFSHQSWDYNVLIALYVNLQVSMTDRLAQRVILLMLCDIKVYFLCMWWVHAHYVDCRYN